MFPRFLPVSFLHHFLLFATFSMYFSKSFTRLLPFSIVFAPFPLVVIAFSCTFTIFFLTCLLHRHSLFVALAPVSSMFQQILHCLFLAFSPDRYHVFLKFHAVFQYILLVGFSICFVQNFLFTTCFLSFSPFSPIGFCTISSAFLHFHTFSIPILIAEFYLFPSFSDPFSTISCCCYHIFLHFHCIFPACFPHRDGLRLAFAPVSSIFEGVFHGLFLAFAPFSSVFHGILCDFLWSLSCFPAVSFFFPLYPHALSGHQKGGPRGNRYPTVSQLPCGT